MLAAFIECPKRDFLYQVEHHKRVEKRERGPLEHLRVDRRGKILPLAA